MKKLTFLVVLAMIVASLQAQEAVKLSGSLTFMTQTNSLFTGGRFSDKPALNATVNMGYKGFALKVGRNSDLLDSKSAANLSDISLGYAKSWGGEICNICINGDKTLWLCKEF